MRNKLHSQDLDLGKSSSFVVVVFGTAGADFDDYGLRREIDMQLRSFSCKEQSYN